MTTASTSATLAQDTYAHMQAWVGEIYTQLVTNCGLLQTQDSGQATVAGGNASWTSGALPTATGVANAVAYFCFSFSDAAAAGALATTTLVAGGSGYSNGSQTGLIVTGATSGATNARATCVVTGGVAANLTITTAGSGYIAGEKLTVNLAGGGSNAAFMARAMTSGAPVVFRLDFGGGTATTAPQMWITVGSSSNGSGTIDGTAGTSRMTQVAALAGAAASSLVTVWTSRYVWNSTYGFCGVAFKLASNSVANGAMGGFVLFRTCDSNGNPTGNAAVLISNSATTTGVGSSNVMQCMSYASGVGSTIYPTLVAASSISFCAGLAQYNASTNAIFGLSSTLENATVFIFPIYTMDPSIRFNAYVGQVMVNDVAVGNTFSCAIIGSTALTFLNIGLGFGNTNANGAAGQTNASACMVMLWQ